MRAFFLSGSVFKGFVGVFGFGVVLGASGCLCLGWCLVVFVDDSHIYPDGRNNIHPTTTSLLGIVTDYECVLRIHGFATDAPKVSTFRIQ